jgi:hypothetical protein
MERLIPDRRLGSTAAVAPEVTLPPFEVERGPSNQAGQRSDSTRAGRSGDAAYFSEAHMSIRIFRVGPGRQSRLAGDQRHISATGFAAERQFSAVTKLHPLPRPVVPHALDIAEQPFQPRGPVEPTAAGGLHGAFGHA